MNDAGLVVALSFGGRKAVGLGFSSSIIVRYFLQTCATVKEAKAALSRLPVYMSYNFTVLDRSGEYITAYTAPDRPAVFDHVEVSTNHQQRVEWPEYAQFTQTVERQAHLAKTIAGRSDLDRVIEAFLKPPLFRYEYTKASGTLYTVAYDPHSINVSMYWHGVSAVISPDSVEPIRVRINYMTA